MSNFTFILPMLIGDLIDLEDDVWKYYLILRQIVEILLAKDIQEECCNLLVVLVADRHKMFIKLFQRNIKPKQHNMTHYGFAIKQSGPLNALSTIRYEAKHKFFKDAANSTSSRKNITYTLAVKHAFNFANRILGKIGLKSDFKIGPGMIMH